MKVHGTDGLSEAVKDPGGWQYFDALSGERGSWKDFSLVGDPGSISVHWLSGCDWRRVPLQPAEAVKEAEAVTMTAKAAMEWLRVDDSRVVRNQYGRAWAFNGCTFVCFGVTTSYGSIPDGDAYTPLIPATRAQVEMERKLSELQRNYDDACVQGTRVLRERDSAIGSQKAAVAALEQERMHNAWLRNSLEMCAKYFGDASVDSLRQNIAKVFHDIDETAGKGAGDGI